LEHDESNAKWKGKGKKRSVKPRSVDLYALLGLQHERWLATQDRIKAAYRKAALLHHPDKLAAGLEDEAAKAEVEERFKAIQDAYETLSDPTKRREYDSIDDFDDSLPLEAAPADFFRVFGTAFLRNARWSVVQPVPELGDDDTAWQQVEAFYDFWFSFKSWRESPHPDEEDVEGAESREHRRWIERYNAKLREKGKKDEFKRIRDFVDAAYKYDPR
jgi:DnaJ homolog subfamily C member 2